MNPIRLVQNKPSGRFSSPDSFRIERGAGKFPVKSFTNLTQRTDPAPVSIRVRSNFRLKDIPNTLFKEIIRARSFWALFSNPNSPAMNLQIFDPDLFLGKWHVRFYYRENPYKCNISVSNSRWRWTFFPDGTMTAGSKTKDGSRFGYFPERRLLRLDEENEIYYANVCNYRVAEIIGDNIWLDEVEPCGDEFVPNGYRIRLRLIEKY